MVCLNITKYHLRSCANLFTEFQLPTCTSLCLASIFKSFVFNLCLFTQTEKMYHFQMIHFIDVCFNCLLTQKAYLWWLENGASSAFAFAFRSLAVLLKALSTCRYRRLSKRRRYKVLVNRATIPQTIVWNCSKWLRPKLNRASRDKHWLINTSYNFLTIQKQLIHTYT